MSLSRWKMNQNVIFECKQFFNVWHVEEILVPNLMRCIFFNPNLTRCKTFKSKSDVIYYFLFKIWHVVKFLNQNLLSKLSFQILAEFLSKCYQHQRTTCWIMTTACEKKKIFCECVACVCLTFGTIFLNIAFFMALGFLVGVMNISFALPID